MKSIKYSKIFRKERGEKMAVKAPILLDHKRKVENVFFKLNPRIVEIEVPTLTCERTQEKFFHPDDVDNVIDALEKEYNKPNQKLKK